MKRYTALVMTMLLAMAGILRAQVVTVNVTPTSPVLPPQAALYVDDPGRFFTVTLTNLSDNPVNVFLGIALEQTFPGEITLHTPVNQQPSTPVSLLPYVPKTLTRTELKTLFREMSLSDVVMTGGNLNDFTSGTVGLMPEGQYMGRIVAYRWDPSVYTPEALSNPLVGSCNFSICYRAAAPVILSPADIPSASSLLDEFAGANGIYNAVEVDFNKPVTFSWTPVTQSCAAVQPVVTYDLEFFRLGKDQSPEDAVRYSMQSAFHKYGLSQTTFIYNEALSSTQSRFLEGEYYVMRVKANSTYNDASRNDYLLLENQGYSPLRVIRIKPYGSSSDNDESDEEEGSTIGDKQRKKPTSTEPRYAWPELTKPEDRKGVWTASRLDQESDIKLEWNEPKPLVESDAKPSFKYIVGVYKVTNSDVEDLPKLVSKGTPIYEKSGFTIKSHTIPWAELKDKLAMGEDYMAIVRCETDSKINISDVYGNNCYRFTYDYQWTSTQPDCNSKASDAITDKTAVAIEASKDNPKKVTIGAFSLFITSAKEVEGNSHAYSGEGYVIWSPYGQDLKFAVSFSELCVNKDDVVFEGEARSKAADGASTFADMFSEIGDYCTSLADVPYLTLANALGGNYASDALSQKMGSFYKYTNEASAAYSILASGMGIETNVPISLPVSVPEDMIPDLPLSVSISHMRFSPNTAALSLMAMVKLPGSDPNNTSEILAFGCPYLCITPNSLWADQGAFGLLYDWVVTDPDSKLPLKFKAPTDWSNLDGGGTFITWRNGEFDCLGIDAECTLKDLYKDLDGKRDKQNHPTLSVQTVIRDWDDWLVNLEVDPFQIPEAPGFSFAAGDQVVFDHSIRRNATGFALPGNYRLKTSGFGRVNEWQGLYIKRMEMMFPSMLSVTDNEPDAGTDGTPDEPAFQKNGRLTLALNEFLLDMAPKGAFVSFDFGAEKIFSAGTVKMGGWGISLDRIYFTMLQNTFVHAGFEGEFKVPLLKGTIGYQAMLEATHYVDKNGDASGDDELELIFKTRQAKDLSLDFFLAEADFMAEGTYFQIKHQFESDYRPANTEVELFAAGRIDILSDKCSDGTKKSKIGFTLPGIKFVGMRLGNHSYAEAHDGDWLGAGFDASMEEFLKSGNSNVKYDADGLLQTSAGTSTQKGQAHNDDIRPKDDRGKTTDEIITKREVELANGQLYFSLGSWSKASPQKNFWGLPFSMGAPSLSMSDLTTLNLDLSGTLSLFGEAANDAAETMNGLATTAMFTIKAGIDNLTEALGDMDISKLDIKYQGVGFKEFDVKGSFGGGMVTAEGHVKVIEDGSKDGFTAELGINVNKLFDISVAGAYYKVSQGYRAGYFAGKVESEEGIPIGPVNLKGINGGFLFNMGLPTGLSLESADMFQTISDNAQLRKGSFGGAFGLKMTVGEESFIKGGLGMLVMYDAQRDRLSTFHLTGTVDAINMGDADGLVHAKCDIVYEDTPDVSQFTLNVTVDAQADMATMYKSFTGTDLKLPEALAGLEQFDSDNADDQGEDNGQKSSTSADGTRTKSSTEQNAEKKGLVSGGVGAHLSLEFQFRHYKNRTGKGKNQWHLYLGQPTPETERCRITFIDFAIGKGKPVGLWAKVYANAYLCLGNELPGNGQLPPIPAKVEEALGGIGADNKSHAGEFSKKLAAAQQEVIKNGPTGNINGGVMFGAALGAEIGVNALFCYASVEAMLGFDVALKKFEPGCKCSDGKDMGGKNGFYATGQIYAMLKGELGLIVDLWFYEGKIPLVDMTVGALLKGGLPNPSWAYGKVRAKGDILGGLIKFNSTVEMKVGRICVPDGGNPLDDIEIFGDYTIGEEDYRSAWSEGNEVSPNPVLDFTTNMPMDTPIDLFDESKAAEKAGLSGDLEDFRYDRECLRTYKFLLNKTFKVTRYTSDNPSRGSYAPTGGEDGFYAPYTTSNTDRLSHQVDFGPLAPEAYYAIHLEGYAKQKVNGQWLDPRFKENGVEVVRPWSDSKDLYFKTDKLSANVMDNVAFSIPFSSGRVRKDGTKVFSTVFAADFEALNPQFIMDRSRADLWNSPEFEYYGQLHKLSPDYNVSGYRITDKKTGTAYEFEELPDAAWRKAGVSYVENPNTGVMEPAPGSEPKYDYVEMAETCERSATLYSPDSYLYYTFMPKTPLDKMLMAGLYRFRVVRLRKAELQDYMDALEERFESMLKRTSNGELVYEEQYDEGMEADPTSGIAREMFDYYTQMKEELGNDEAEQRMMAYRQQVLADSRSKFSDVMGEMFYVPNGSADMAQWLEKVYGEQLTATTGTNASSNYNMDMEFMQYQVYSVEHSDSYNLNAPTNHPSYWDPYVSIQTWGQSMIQANFSDEYRLFTKSVEAQPMKITLNNYATNYKHLVKYRNYSTGFTLNGEYHAGGGEVDSSFVQNMSIANQDMWFKGIEHFGVLTNELSHCLVTDAAMAVRLDQQMANDWYTKINKEKYLLADLKTVNSSDNVYKNMKDRNSCFGDSRQYVKWTTSGSLEWPQYQYVLMLGAENRDMESYNDHWLTSTKFRRWPNGSIYRLELIRQIYGGDYWLPGEDISSHTIFSSFKNGEMSPVMPRTKYSEDGEGSISVDSYNRNHSQFLRDYNNLPTNEKYHFSYDIAVFDYKTYVDNLKSITYRVRRLTGYNCCNSATERYGMRPSTMGKYQATLTLPINQDGSKFATVTEKEYKSSDLTIATADTIYVPDPQFRAYLFNKAKADLNGDNRLQRSEAEAIESINITNTCGDVHDLTGIEAMKNLESLTITQSNASIRGPEVVDLSSNTKLHTIRLDINGIESLNVSNCRELFMLTVGPFARNYNRTTDRSGLTSIDLRNCPELAHLDVHDNLLTSLDLSQNRKLKTLICHNNMISELDLSHLSNLSFTATGLRIGRQMEQSTARTYQCNRLLCVIPSYVRTDDECETVGFIYDVSGKYYKKWIGARVELTIPTITANENNYNANVFFRARSLSQKIVLDLDPCLYQYIYENFYTYESGRKTIDFVKLRNATTLKPVARGIKTLKNLGTWMPALTTLDCSGNELYEIDLDEFPKLVSLDCRRNKIYSISATKQSSLTTLRASENRVQGFSGTNHPDLQTIDLHSNGLTSIVLKQNTALRYLLLGDNKLTRLDISNAGPNLEELDLHHNWELASIIGTFYSVRKLDLSETALVLTVDGHFTKIEELNLSTSGCSFIFANIAYPQLRVLKLRGTTITGNNNQTTPYVFNEVEWPKLEYLDMAHVGSISDYRKAFGNAGTTIYVDSSVLRYLDVSNSYALNVWLCVPCQLDTLKMGLHKLGQYGISQKAKVMLANDRHIAKWEQWRLDPDNYGVVPYSGDINLTGEELTFNEQDTPGNIATMRNAIGDRLYQRLKDKYAPDALYFTVSMANSLDSLDCHGLGLESTTSLETYFPNIVWLDCSANYLKTMPSFKKLNYLDISDNPNITTANFSSTGLKNVKTLIAKNTGLRTISNATQSALVKVDLSASSITLSALQSLLNAGVETIVVQNCKSIQGTLSLTTQAVNYLDASGTGLTELSVTGAPSLKHLDVHGAKLGMMHDRGKGSVIINSSNIRYLDLHDNWLYRIDVLGFDIQKNVSLLFDDTDKPVLLCGCQKDPISSSYATSARDVLLELCEYGDETTRKAIEKYWLNNWSKRDENRRVNLLNDIDEPADNAVHVIPPPLAVQKLMDALGERLYQRLKATYAPDEMYLTPEALIDVDSLDCSHLGLTSLAGVATYMPKLRMLDCSDNALSSIPNSFSVLEYLNVSGNADLKMLNARTMSLRNVKELVAQNSCISLILEPNYLGAEVVDLTGSQTTFALLQVLCSVGVKKIIVRDCQTITGDLSLDNSGVEYLDASGTHLTGLTFSGATSLTHLDVHGAWLGKSQSNTNLALPLTIDAPALNYMDLHNNFVTKISVVAITSDRSQAVTFWCGRQKNTKLEPIETSLCFGDGTTARDRVMTMLWNNTWSKHAYNSGVKLVTTSSLGATNTSSSGSTGTSSSTSNSTSEDSSVPTLPTSLKFGKSSTSTR